MLTKGDILREMEMKKTMADCRLKTNYLDDKYSFDKESFNKRASELVRSPQWGESTKSLNKNSNL